MLHLSILILFHFTSYSFIHLPAAPGGREPQDGTAADGRGGDEGEIAYIQRRLLDLLMSSIVDRYYR